MHACMTSYLDAVSMYGLPDDSSDQGGEIIECGGTHWSSISESVGRELELVPRTIVYIHCSTNNEASTVNALRFMNRAIMSSPSTGAVMH